MFCKEKIKLNESYCDYQADPEVTSFIREFLARSGNEEAAGAMQEVFSAGYCYYFAHMLKLAFERGKVCWCAPYGHFCWLDEDAVPYDIYGICTSEAEYFIPERYLGSAVADFLHNGRIYGATEEEIQSIIAKYKEDRKEQL